MVILSFQMDTCYGRKSIYLSSLMEGLCIFGEIFEIQKKKTEFMTSIHQLKKKKLSLKKSMRICLQEVSSFQMGVYTLQIKA